ncbi:MAG: MFS transporter [Alphaproteobacteria bacterium]|nr:MFS transporter [Alphaproteobacteria bacterium]
MEITAAPGLGARKAAVRTLSVVLRQRQPLDSALAGILAETQLEPRDAGFARAIVSQTLRRFGQLNALIAGFAPKPLAPHRCGAALEILLAGACELMFLSVPAHAAVDAANRLAAADTKARHFKGLINAVLRRVAREGREQLLHQDAARLNTPDWLWQRWCDAYGETYTRQIAQRHGEPAALDIHGKPGFAGPAEAIILPGGLWRLPAGTRLEAIAGFDEGLWWVQDFAASLPARLFGDVDGARVLDLCAAPGGKTAELAVRGARVTAIERDPARLDRLAGNLKRLGLSAEQICADLRDWRPSDPYPFVLLDAPCSATGTIRRHPELPWIKSAADVTFCAALASELLDAAADMTAPSGTLVFAVCSLEPEEGCEQIARFLERHADFQRIPLAADDVFGLDALISADGDLRTLPCHLPHLGGMDGFYAARLRRSA